ncbi:DUF503 domain-containing protein [bacterium]|nr:DUF503 domain-containing protein [bacterium]
MEIGICSVELYIPSVLSLKGKRMILKSLLTKIRNKYNVSISEVDHNDLWQRSTLTMVTVANDRKRVDQVLNNVRKFIEMEKRVSIIDYETEMY